MGNPIKYSDLVVPDSSITDLIQQLQELAKTYAAMQKEIVGEAQALRNALKDVSGATEEGRKQIDEDAKKADELAAATQRLTKAQSELGADLANLNAKLKEQNRLNALNAQEVTSMAGSYNQMAASLAKAKLEYSQLIAVERNSKEGAELREKIARISGQIKAYNIELQKNIKLQEEKAKRDASAIGSYNRLSAVYNILKIKLNAMGEATEKDAAAKRKMEEAAKAVYAQMVKLQEATGKHTLSVGNYAKHWDGLRFSIFQVVRELPNAAVSLSTLFLAISNNLPVVADELSLLKKRNAELRAEGKPTQSALKAITGALFSWHTAMILGISALTMYGDKITKFISDLFKGKAAAKSFTEAMEDLREEITKNGSEYGKNLVAYKKLQAEWKNLKSLKEQEKFIKENTSAWQQLDVQVRNVTEAENVLVGNTDTVVAAIMARAKAVAAEKLATEKYEEYLKKRMEYEKKYTIRVPVGVGKDGKIQYKNMEAGADGSGVETWQQIGLSAMNASAYSPILDQRNRTLLASERDAALADAEMFIKLSQNFFGDADQMLREKGIGKYQKEDAKKGKKGGSTKELRDMTKDVSKIIRDVQQALNESRTALMSDGGLNHTVEVINDKVNKAINQMEDMRGRIQHWLDNPKKFKLTEKQQESLRALGGLIDMTIGNIKAKGSIDAANASTAEFAKETQFAASMRKLGAEGTTGLSLGVQYAQRRSILRAEQDAELAALNDTYKLRADLIEKGDADELKRLEQFTQEWELLTKKHALQRVQLGVDFANDLFGYNQQLASVRFNGQQVSPTRREKLQFNYDQQMAKYRQQLKDPNTTPEQAELIKAQMDAATVQFKKDYKAKDIWEVMGIKMNDEQKQAIATSTQYAMEAMNSLMQLEQAWADKAVENAQRRVDATKNALQIEKEARANGYANNVEYAQKEYEAAKKQQDKALKQRARVQKAMIAIQTAEQISSLVTASAEIWRTFSQMSQPWLAPAMIGVMWASFAASKIMAAKMADVQNDKEEYGEGTVELLQGGSHASGNDIDLGTKPNGTKRRAEGGEFFAVINRRNSRKYKHQIPDIINSLNRGDFDKKYLTAEQASADLGKFIAAYDKAGRIIVAQAGGHADLSRLERDVRLMREQGENTVTFDSRGNEIRIHKNLRQVIAHG